MHNLFLTYGTSEGKKVNIKAHGGIIDVEGVLVAKVNDKLQIQSIDVWFDPMAMFKQMLEKRESS